MAARSDSARIRRVGARIGTGAALASLLAGGASAATAPASRAAACRDAAPGRVQIDELFHDSGPLYLQPPEPDARSLVTLTFRAAACDLSAAALVYRPAPDAPLQSVSMARVGRDATGRHDLWRVAIRMGARGTLFSYRFREQDGAATQYLGASGAAPTAIGAGKFSIAVGFHTPGWAQDAIFYQIFPDRFRNGNPSNDVRTGEYRYQGLPVLAQPWTALPENPGRARDFFGGDLQGIDQEITPYLKRTLGVTALYLNPIFRSLSNHKYDTQDYLAVDPHFGSNADLAALVAHAHRATAFAGDYPMRIVLDGVFNHSGDSIRWFNKERLYPPVGAYNTRSSPYFSFYSFTHWPDQYDDFQGCCPTLPRLNYGSPALRAAIYRAPDSVMQRYLRAPYGIDGWRLDAADNVGNGTDDNHAIWQDVRRSVKPAAPQGLLLGETWGAAQGWLDGTQWDGAMNYAGFGVPISQWVTGRDAVGTASTLPASGLNATLLQSLAALPRPAQLVMLNSLSTHDVPRFLYRAGGHVGELNVAQILQMTLIGAPCIYYGDEIGMTGATDPDDRRPFDWRRERWNSTVLNLARRLIALRKATPVLRTGSFTGLLTDDDHHGYAFGRWQAGQRAVVVLNDDAHAHRYTIDVAPVEAMPGSSWSDALRGGTVGTAGNDTISVELGAYSGAVLVQTQR